MINWLRSLFALLIELRELKSTPPSSISTNELFCNSDISDATVIQFGSSFWLKPIAKHFLFVDEYRFSKNFIPKAVLPAPRRPNIIPI